MATKKEKAKIAVSCLEVRRWVIDHLLMKIECHGSVTPTDLWNSPVPIEICDKPYGKELFKWLNDPKHLYNADGAIELMKAVLTSKS